MPVNTGWEHPSVLFRCSSVVTTSLCHLPFQVQSGCHPSYINLPSFITPVKSDERSRRQQVVRLPSAVGATALVRVCLVSMLPEGSGLCTHCFGRKMCLVVKLMRTWLHAAS